MAHKRKVANEDLGRLERELLGLETATRHYVTFSKGHLRVDVGGYIRSPEGKRSVSDVIRVLPGKRKKSASDTSGADQHVRR